MPSIKNLSIYALTAASLTLASSSFAGHENAFAWSDRIIPMCPAVISNLQASGGIEANTDLNESMVFLTPKGYTTALAGVSQYNLYNTWGDITESGTQYLSQEEGEATFTVTSAVTGKECHFSVITGGQHVDAEITNADCAYTLSNGKDNVVNYENVTDYGLIITDRDFILSSN